MSFLKTRILVFQAFTFYSINKVVLNKFVYLLSFEK